MTTKGAAAKGLHARYRHAPRPRQPNTSYSWLRRTLAKLSRKTLR